MVRTTDGDDRWALISPWPPRLDGAEFDVAVWQDDVVEWHRPGEVFVYRPRGPASGSLCVVEVPPPVQFRDVPVLEPLAPRNSPDALIDEKIVAAGWDWGRLLGSTNQDQDFSPLQGSQPALPPSAASGPPPAATVAARSASRQTTVTAMARTSGSILSKLLLRE
ncbi:hypothetical protein [Cellulomonas chitinilytica]|uniref:hypothetical protein n=1 Tax=Cellulomonas chitinilytica TaxID=398759 RepID=UPI0019456884|nr:hypothetical protein [Cellulomonas chitinilytica]